ncbi:spore coat protein [Paenibacillus zeisoli]|uniref:Spore coat protein n=1 Tax=Paenibacillus zeisoli TaxID=2496267 RepID=A0A433X330_9BACL|nr:spore coat protein [Paenibacillus zeisoli]RUT28471.1 spore coat protein [Paenibacillus zeisoli]
MNNQANLAEQDILNTILADLRRTAREYTTATTESSCQTVRQMFNQLTDGTLRLQGELYQLMQHNGSYQSPSHAPRQEVDKLYQHATQTQQKSQQYAQMTSAQGNASQGESLHMS